MFCQIRVKGHLSSAWADWFDGLIVTNEENGEALLTGSFLDQAALFGVLNRLQVLNLTLVSVVCTPGADDSPHDSSSDE